MHHRDQDSDAEGRQPHQTIGLIAGAALALGMLLAPAPAGLSEAGWQTMAIAALMAVWWASEAIPLAATALVPLIAFPMLGIRPLDATAAPYAHPLIFLFMGGFLLALAIERWNLHRRIALTILRIAGGHPRQIIPGFMLATGVLSMWISNTATTLMMLPIALSVAENIATHEEGDPRSQKNFVTGLLLAVAYAASIAGLATLIGTPPNAFFAGFMSESYGIDIGFAQWMLFGLPITLVMMIAAWFVLTRLAFPFDLHPESDARAHIDSELAELGPMSRAEKRVGIVFVLVAASWMLRGPLSTLGPLSALSDPVIAMTGGLALFLIPSGTEKATFLMDWRGAQKLPWGVLILFGGGLSLAGAIDVSGLAGWLGGGLSGLEGLAPVILILAAAALVIVLTELTSNLATTATFLPVVAALAVGMGEAPMLLAAPAAVAASCAFMLPVATPPNAIVFGSEEIRIGDMIRAGLWLNLIGIAVITALAVWLAPLVFG